MAGKKFPKTTIQIVTALCLGIRKDDSIAGYLKRISQPKHDDSTHKFVSSPVLSGVCQDCGWIHPDLHCADCPRPVQEHVADAALLFEATEGDQGDAIIIVVTSSPWRGWPFS